MTHNCCSKGRCQQLWFWVCSFGEKHFLNHTRFSIHTETQEWNSRAFTRLWAECNWCVLYSHRNPAHLLLGVLFFSPLIPYLPFLLSSSKVLHIEQFLSLLPLTFNDQVLGNNRSRIFVPLKSALSHTLPTSHILFSLQGQVWTGTKRRDYQDLVLIPL